jgi:hypothetical protein
VIILVCGVLSVPSGASAGGRFELTWRAPQDCPDEQSVVAEAARILHKPIELPDDGRLAVQASVKSPTDAGQWHVDLETDNGQHVGRRSLDASTCDELARATSLFIAIMIDPAAATNAAPAPASPSPPADAGPASHSDLPANAAERPEAVVRSSEPARRTVPTLSLGASFGVLGGHLPSWSAGAGVHAVAEWPWFRAELGGRAWLPARQTVDSGGVQGADFQLFSGEAKVCLMLPGKAVKIGPCGGADLAFISGKGFGPRVNSQASTATFWSISAGGLLVWRASNRLSFPIGLEALFALSPPQFTFTGTDPGPVYRPSGVGARVTLGAELRL